MEDKILFLVDFSPRNREMFDLSKPSVEIEDIQCYVRESRFEQQIHLPKLVNCK